MSSRADVFLVDNTLRVSGCLDVDTVVGCRDSGTRLMAGLGRVVIDLSEVEVSGSASVALLIAWQREARSRGTEIEIHNPPGQLIDIARACGLEEILPFR